MNTKRRDFLKNSALAAAAVSVTPTLLNACASPSEKIRVALIGCRSMGFTDLQSFLREDNNTVCVALCDVDTKILEQRAGEVEKQSGTRPLTYTDFRQVLDNKDVDAVIIGTPDHWHANMTILALQAGKHVYVEKPMAHSIEECNAMIAAQKAYPELNVQVGMWQRSSKHWFEASEIVQSGILGGVHLVKAWIYKGYDEAYPALPDAQAPEYVDYDMWLGPAPKRAFNANRFHYNFRWWWDYAGGAMTDWGVHLLDFALHGMNAGTPISVTPGGGIFYHQPGALETPDIQQAIYAYPTHTMMWEAGLNPGIGPYQKGHGVAFIGEKGTLVVSRSGYELIPDRSSELKGPFFEARSQENYGDGLNEHIENFLAAIRSGEKLNAPVEVGAKTTIVAEMGNIAYRVGQRIHWDDAAQAFKEQAANAFMKLKYNPDWELPKV